MNNFFKQRNKGFTLVETLVAISIFSASLMGLMVILGGGLSNTNFAQKKITATYLAQQGIEYVRNMRDSDLLNDINGGWVQFRDTDIASVILPAVDDGTFYPSPDASFTRYIQATVVTSDEIRISSRVRWTQGSGPFNVTFSESLFNWIE